MSTAPHSDMATRASEDMRILAVYPTTRGFGFTVFEGVESLIEWGVVQVRANKQARTLERVGTLIDRYEPSLLALEDPDDTGSRRVRRIRRLVEALAAFSRKRRIPVRHIKRRAVRRCFAEVGMAKKAHIAAAVATRFPELGPHLPPTRKAWMTEDPRMSIFDAASLAVVHFAVLERRKNRPTTTA